MKITFSSIAALALASASGTLAAPVKPQGKGHPNLSANNVAKLKEWGWLPANYPVKGPSESPSNSGVPTTSAKPAEWWSWKVARVSKLGGDDDHYYKMSEYGFEISVSTNPECGVIMDGARSKGSSPEYRDTPRSWDNRFDIMHDRNYQNGRHTLETNGQQVNWDLIGKYTHDEDERYIHIYNHVHACFNWPR
ncbi:hypothetical protein BGX24_002654 [Mortierella sp. AD032]|nr:hypothetical protein BGX24_002654 [Mortierella sp. AD032]